MDFYGIPFAYRVLFLILVLMAVGALDYLRNREKATRWREYVFLVVCAAVGAAVGASTDAVTSRISPEYFTLYKDVPDGDGFASRVLLLGAHAGFLAGAVAAICCLVANNPRSGLPALPYRTLSGVAFIPLASAVTGGLVAGVSLTLGAAESAVPFVDVPLEPDRSGALVSAWGVHTAIYSGLVVGVVIAVIRIRRRRRAFVESKHAATPGAQAADP